MDLLSLALLCGPLVHPQMTLRVIEAESRGVPFAIHDNSSAQHYAPQNLQEAVSLSTRLIEAGHRLDLGLMQINYEAWLRPTGFALQRAFDPCTNIALGTTILSHDYAQALAHSTTTDDALLRSLSLYNSGSQSRSMSYAQAVLTGRGSTSILVPNSRVSAERARRAAVTFASHP